MTVHVSASAVAAIEVECSRRGDLETGGWLIGPLARSWHADRSITDATVAATRRTTGSVDLDSEAFRRADGELRAAWNRGIDDERRAIGDWHSHPFHVDTAAERAKINQPSAADLRAWSSDLSGFADHNSSLTSLIVTRRDGAFNGSWVNPNVSAWITRYARSSFGERMVCEPAIVSVR